MKRILSPLNGSLVATLQGDRRVLKSEKKSTKGLVNESFITTTIIIHPPITIDRQVVVLLVVLLLPSLAVGMLLHLLLSATMVWYQKTAMIHVLLLILLLIVLWERTKERKKRKKTLTIVIGLNVEPLGSLLLRALILLPLTIYYDRPLPFVVDPSSRDFSRWSHLKAVILSKPIACDRRSLSPTALAGILVQGHKLLPLMQAWEQGHACYSPSKIRGVVQYHLA